MDIKSLVHAWFQAWDNDDYLNIPISENFRHMSPYGTIEGKQAYLDLVMANKDKFLPNKFDFHDTIYLDDRVCVRYAIRSETYDLQMELSDWLYARNGLLTELHAY